MNPVEIVDQVLEETSRWQDITDSLLMEGMGLEEAIAEVLKTEDSLVTRAIFQEVKLRAL
jgi:hypothetical protein